VLKSLEYHRGVPFLTTIRIQTSDEAFLSRFSIDSSSVPVYISLKQSITAIRYPELDDSARLTIWRKFFELARCSLWRSEPEGFIALDVKEPRCYVSLSESELLAQKPFIGWCIIMPTMTID